MKSKRPAGLGVNSGMLSQTMASRKSPVSRLLRIGSVSFLNAKPLIYGLEDAEDLALLLDVPSRLLADVREGRVDVALLPVIDYQRLSGLVVVPSGGIGCDGPTLTVRIFSRVPIDAIQTLACDTDSHTSVALARIILAERYGIRPEFIDWTVGEATACDSRLLIGDKVVCDEPSGFAHQLDLGAAWKDLTGMPFVFAAWMARKGTALGDLPRRLEEAKRQGLANVEQIIQRHALSRGWPADIARQYLCEYLKYDIGERQLEAIRRFHALAARHEVLEAPPRPLEHV